VLMVNIGSPRSRDYNALHDFQEQTGYPSLPVPFSPRIEASRPAVAVLCHDIPRTNTARASLRPAGCALSLPLFSARYSGRREGTQSPDFRPEHSNSPTAPRTVKSIFPAGVLVSRCSEMSGTLRAGCTLSCILVAEGPDGRPRHAPLSSNSVRAVVLDFAANG
jgi:hypothetical protein